ncbi:MAG: methionyl-tRNA formyltransferase, partial [Gemmatimonadota bacterium]|nr:methionyl-tRNA formyltransferase [Gemmatimonadota bacterium]
ARIDWALSADRVACHVRGMDRIPGAWSELDGKPIKMFGPRPERADPAADAGMEPGAVLVADPALGLRVAAGEGSVWIAEVQPPGRTRIPANDWIRGRGVAGGQRFE